MTGTMQIDGKTAVVVGGGSGVGRGIALGLAAQGMRVAVADIDADAAAGVEDEIAAAGGKVMSRRVDATDRSSLHELAEDVVAQFGAMHVLVNTVGVILDQPLDTSTEEDWAWFLDFNLMANVRNVQEFLPYLRAHGEPAHIVLTSSMAGLLALGPELVVVRNGLYTTTKHAMVGFTDMLRMELAPENIGVSVLCPGLVAGNLGVTSARNRPDRFGGPMPAPEYARTPSSAMPNEQVGPIVAAAIEHNRFYIFTHPDSAEMVKARHQEVLDDYAFYAGLLQGRGDSSGMP
jgi:NAD(P)-dependent dehydrogenase (short-subunit alcohol dehydrogenase family)